MSFKPLENALDFIDTPERMKKSCDDLETEIENNPTEENIEKLKTMKEIMRLLSLRQSGGKSRRRHHRRSSKKHKKARKSRRANRRHSRKH